MNQAVVIYTDGACSGNPGPGGWGALLKYNGQQKEISGFVAHTTNNQMELKAVIQALQQLKRACQVDVYTDSQYVRQGITEWISAWKRRGWRTMAGKPVKNIELWQQLDAEVSKHTVRWFWVKGHSGDPNNDRVDELARLAIKIGEKRA